AISLIKAALAKNPEEQQRGAPYIIDNWHQDWKPILGPYRKFVESCACFRVEQGANSANYTIHVVEGADDGPRPFWIANLNKAWQAYSLLKKEKASVEEFLAEAKVRAPSGVHASNAHTIDTAFFWPHQSRERRKTVPGRSREERGLQNDGSVARTALESRRCPS
ncbi:unnamed protein product, partial [Symbiodinium necroappetens]